MGKPPWETEDFEACESKLDAWLETKGYDYVFEVAPMHTSDEHGSNVRLGIVTAPHWTLETIPVQVLEKFLPHYEVYQAGPRQYEVLSLDIFEVTARLILAGLTEVDSIEAPYKKREDEPEEDTV